MDFQYSDIIYLSAESMQGLKKDERSARIEWNQRKEIASEHDLSE